MASPEIKRQGTASTPAPAVGQTHPSTPTGTREGVQEAYRDGADGCEQVSGAVTVTLPPTPPRHYTLTLPPFADPLCVKGLIVDGIRRDDFQVEVKAESGELTLLRRWR